MYRTCRSQSDVMLLEVPFFASIDKSKKHLGLNFAYDVPRIWNDLSVGIMRLRVCQKGEIKRYKSTIRIRIRIEIL